MVIIYGNPLKKAYTYGREVGSIFCNRAEVWPKDVPAPPEYYISWTPTNLTGTFSIDGTVYNFSDYNGYFSDYNGIITYKAFDGASITTLNTNATFIESIAFRGCKSLSYVSLSSCSYIGMGAFHQCTILSNINIPVCSYIDDDAFNMCRLLSEDVNLPMCEYVGSNAFSGCRSLSQVSLPVCKYIGGGAFAGCTFQQISLPMCEYIGVLAFWQCGNLKTITLASTSVCELRNSTAFDDTPISTSNGSIFVPSSLVTAYKTASNWSYYSSKIQAIPTP